MSRHCPSRGTSPFAPWNQPMEAEMLSDEYLKVLDDVAEERRSQIEKAHGGDTEEFDKSNSRNDWIAYLNSYSGRAAEKVFRNEREGCDFRENMVKVAALATAAIEAHDKGYC